MFTYTLAIANVKSDVKRTLQEETAHQSPVCSLDFLSAYTIGTGQSSGDKQSFPDTQILIQILIDFATFIKYKIQEFFDNVERTTEAYQPIVKKINALEESFANLTDAELRLKTDEFKARLNAGTDTLDSLLPEAFAAVREASKRVLGLRHFDVQLIGGIVLDRMRVAEMKTGEGKTLVATLPAYLNALTGNGVHIVTVNDYLARRDADTMGQVFRFLGMSVGLIQQGLEEPARRAAYACDVTYCTNSELGFDYLRDNMATDANDLVQRGFNFCVVDEVDSILIDEARTPLIISGRQEPSSDEYLLAEQLARALIKDEHYDVLEKERFVSLTKEGYEAMRQMLGDEDQVMFSKERRQLIYRVNNALKAKELFQRDMQYIVRDGEIVIVDEFTGRVMVGRRWSDGLHQAIEAKEEVKVNPENITLGSVTYQSLFKLYSKLSGMTGTAATEAEEFRKVYRMLVTCVPTNRKMIRADLDDLVFINQEEKWKAVTRNACEEKQKGRPVLIGTTSVAHSEIISRLFKSMDPPVPHQVLNAKPEFVEREAEIIAGAGRYGVITISTNMAGRGTDIILGGNAKFMATLRIKEDFFEACVKGDTGTWRPPAELYPCKISAEAQSLIRRAIARAQELYPDKVEALEADDMLAVASESMTSGDPVVLDLRKAVDCIQKEFSERTSQNKEAVVEAGGLHIIGTERHDSRRIDYQLRGRSGRQGDPGSSRFIVSLEDKMLRVFGGDKIKDMMTKFNLPPDTPIEGGLLTKTLEDAQQKVEAFYNGARDSVYRYDKINNKHRLTFFSERRRVLTADRGTMRTELLNFLYMTLNDAIDYHRNKFGENRKTWNVAPLVEVINDYVFVKYAAVDLEECRRLIAMSRDDDLDELREYCYAQGLKAYEAKSAEVSQTIREGLLEEVGRYLAIRRMDELWASFLKNLRALQESTSWRFQMRGSDPMTEYDKESNEAFEKLVLDVRNTITYAIFRVKE